MINKSKSAIRITFITSDKTNKKIEACNFNPKICKPVSTYIGKKGIIKGKKKTNKNKLISLVEFEDHNRIWINLHEIKYL